MMTSLKLLSVWDCLNVPAIAFCEDMIIYRNTCASIRFPEAFDGVNIHNFLGDMQCVLLDRLEPSQEIELYIGGEHYNTEVVETGNVKSLIFMHSSREYKFDGYSEMYPLIAELKEITADFLMCADTVQNTRIFAILNHNIHRMLRLINTYSYLSDSRTCDISIAPAIIDAAQLIETLAVRFSDALSMPNIKFINNTSDIFNVLFDSDLMSVMVMRMLSRMLEQCAGEDKIEVILAREKDSFSIEVRGFGRPFDDYLTELAKSDDFIASECLYEPELDLCVVWHICRRFGGTMSIDENALTLCFPFIPIISNGYEATENSTITVKNDGISLFLTELCKILTLEEYMTFI